MYLLNFLDSLIDSNIIFYILIIVLIVVSIAMFYLVYMQNKETLEEMKRKNSLTNLDKEVNLESIINVEDLMVDDGKSKIIEPTSLNIPEKLEFTQSIYLNDQEELQSITRELETLPKERKIKLTPYEAEQEEKAIISYEELLDQSKNENVNYSNHNEEDVALLNQVELENDAKFELDSIKKDLSKKVDVSSYEHEEAFLKALKQLQELIN